MSANTFSPREQRLLETLIANGWTSRHNLNRLVGAENTPDVVMRARRTHGLDILMEKRPLVDRDGKKIRVGYYNLSDRDRQKLSEAGFEAGGGNGT